MREDTASPSEGALSAFDDIGRGDHAPTWVAEGIRSRWATGSDAIVQMIVLSENATFRVTTSEGTIVVRLGRPGYAVDLDHLRSELLWVAALRDDIGAPTPAPVRGADGDLVQLITDDRGAQWTAVAFDFVAGTVLEEHSDVAGSFGRIGELTAHLHGHSRAWRRPDGFRRFAWHLEDLVGPRARWGDWRGAALSADEAALLERAETAACSALQDAGVTPAAPHFGLIHADLRPSNVMLDGDRLTIIDFDDSGEGYYLYDFAAALTFYEHRPEAPQMAAAWLAGYEQVAPLSAKDREAAAALSMLRRLTMLGWATTHRADALPPDLWDENLPGTVEVAGRYLADRTWLVTA